MWSEATNTVTLLQSWLLIKRSDTNSLALLGKKTSSLFKILPAPKLNIHNFNEIKPYKSMSPLFHKDVTDKELLEMTGNTL